MRSTGIRRRLYLVVAGVVATLALTTPADASTADDPKVVIGDDPGVAAGYNCPQLTSDTGPRRFSVDTIDSSPHGATTRGYIWVDRLSSEYHVCVGWIDGSYPNPWLAYVNDEERGNNREAAVVVQFTDNGARSIITYPQWAAYNTDTGWGFNRSGISNFYVGVCLHIPGSQTYDHCGWESGTPNKYPTLWVG